jgi:hypothetical protein
MPKTLRIGATHVLIAAEPANVSTAPTKITNYHRGRKLALVTRTVVLAVFAAVGLAVSVAEAHFVWLDTGADQAGAPQARVYFGEAPEPGEPHLIGKIAKTVLWVRDNDGRSERLKLDKSSDEKLAAYVASLPTHAAASLEATCDYGVYERGPVGVLLQYYAKHLVGNWSAQVQSWGRAEKLTLDIVPTLDAERLTLAVFYQGKPDAHRDILLLGPDGKHQELKTNEQGRASLEKTAPGRYALRAGHIETDASGDRDGKKFGQTWHYVTLTFEVPAATAASTSTSSTATAESAGAGEMLERARSGRSIWNDFPGFVADVNVTANGGSAAGHATIKSDGTVDLDMPASSLKDWAQEQLQSMVQHRMPDGEVNTGKVTYRDDDQTHPLGRQIDLGDPDLESRYRIKDDQILEVSRKMGPMRFVISVLETIRNDEGKYLPQAFTMNFFDGASGTLKTSLAFRNDWQRVGEFDLPKRVLETNAQNGLVTTREMLFSNCRLLDRK